MDLKKSSKRQDKFLMVFVKSQGKFGRLSKK
jgi:hypothetical protein